MTRVIAMIPARLGSKRVIKKNLRLIHGKPMIGYIIEKVVEAGIFDDIYLNSEAEIFREIAENLHIKYYKRPEKYSSDSATNDEFAYDFMNHVPGNILIQILPTSPLIKVSDIRDFTEAMIKGNYDSLISVEASQIACVFNNKPVNFNPLKTNPPSQQMTPVNAYATALMGWTYESFIKNVKQYGSAYHGGKGHTGYYELRGLATIDIDREEDFSLVEAIINSGYLEKKFQKPEYYGDIKDEHSEVDVPDILKKDGVKILDFEEENVGITNVAEIIKQYGRENSWSKRLVNTENNSATLICQLPGEGNRLHYHPEWNEWWYIIAGEWEWEIEGKKFIVKKDDVVFIRKKLIHKITAIGNESAIRLAVSRADVPNVYPKIDN